MRNRTLLRFTLIEWLVAAIFLLVLARIFWAQELAELEDSLFASIGRDGGAKYLITVPLVLGDRLVALGHRDAPQCE